MKDRVLPARGAGEAVDRDPRCCSALLDHGGQPRAAFHALGPDRGRRELRRAIGRSTTMARMTPSKERHWMSSQPAAKLCASTAWASRAHSLDSKFLVSVGCPVGHCRNASPCGRR
jgi:hypothetical protein